MKIQLKILCDQKDCIYNEGSKVHHDHETDICTHLSPKIYSQLKTLSLGEKLCVSKKVNQPKALIG